MSETSKRLNLRSLVLGIVGIVFSVLLPGVTIACSVPGIVSAVKRHGRNGIPGLALNITALSLAAANSAAAIVLTFRMFEKRV
jgi:hypothetical protein